MGFVSITDQSGRKIYDSRLDDVQDDDVKKYLASYEALLAKSLLAHAALRVHAKTLRGARKKTIRKETAALLWQSRRVIKNIKNIREAAIRREQDSAIHNDLAYRGILPFPEEP